MSTFTALNGASPKSLESQNPPAREALKAPSDENATSQPSLPDAKKSTAEASTGHREAWSGPGAERPNYAATSYPDVEGSHKRKRSDSIEPRREKEPQTIQERTPDTATQPHPLEPRDVYGTSQRDRDGRPYAEETREHGESWYARTGRDEQRAFYDQQPPASSARPQADEHSGEAEALRRATGQVEAQSDYGNTSPDGDEKSATPYASYPPGAARDAAAPSDPKKRKRNFSNRTKTGCLTCRRRKKKCDEQKPECKLCFLPPTGQACLYQ